MGNAMFLRKPHPMSHNFVSHTLKVWETQFWPSECGFLKENAVPSMRNLKYGKRVSRAMCPWGRRPGLRFP
eukprot:4861934-Pyramimonas_sp.AAC.1